MKRTIFSRIPFRYRFIFLLALPGAGMLSFAGILASEKYGDLVQAREEERLAVLAPAITTVAAELQRERGTASGYISSGSKSFGTRYPEQRRKTDVAIDSFLDATISWGEEQQAAVISNYLEDAVAALKNLNQVRAEILRQELEVAEAVEQYTQIIRSVRAVFERLMRFETHPNQQKLNLAYAALVKAQESVGRQRALGVAQLGWGQPRRNFEASLRNEFAKEQAQLEIVKAYAPVSMWQTHLLKTSRLSDQVADLYRAALPSTGGPTAMVSPEDWYAITTQEVNHLRVLADALVAHIQQQARLRSERSYRDLWILGLLITVFSTLSLGLAIEMARGLVQSLRRLASSMQTLASGETMAETLPSNYHNELGDMYRALETFQQQYQERERLENEKQKELEAHLNKNRFIASASHDLRQPLQVLSLFVDTMNLHETDPRNRVMLKKMQRNIKSFRHMLNGLLDVSRMESGYPRNDRSSFPLAPLLRQLEDEYRALAREKGLEFRCVLSSATVYSDPTLVETMLRNLLDNALKYTKRGRILLGCRKAGKRIRVEVWDTGAGIPEALQARIWEEFYQVMPSTDPHRGGLGLGLAIVIRLSRAVGATLRFHSTPDSGSVFALELPQEENDEAEDASSTPPDDVHTLLGQNQATSQGQTQETNAP